LCELLTANPRAAEYLAKFQNESLFLLPIETDDPDPWYGFLHLLRVFLERRLLDEPPAELAKLHQIASNWFSGKNCVAEQR
jgi:ATP/maltotriose-dependent transcriptional regulator MalT